MSAWLRAVRLLTRRPVFSSPGISRWNILRSLYLQAEKLFREENVSFYTGFEEDG